MNKIKLLFLILAIGLFGKEQTDVLFYLQDAGETYALLPVIRKLEEKGVDYRVLAAGVAEEVLSKSGLPAEKIRRLKDLHVATPVGRSWSRSEKLSASEIGQISEEIDAKKVVTGVAFELQGQVLDSFSKRGIPTFAYWDNFNAEGENPYFQTAHSVEKRAEILLLPSHFLESAFGDRKIRIVGQPTLQEWIREERAVDRDRLRHRLGIEKGRKIAVWIGGYGTDYEEAFRVFLAGMSQMEDLLFLIQPHPKTNPNECLALGKNCRILKGELTTLEAVALADLVVCHQSTVAFQALALGKPVLHLIPAGQHFTSQPLENGLAKKVALPEEFPAACRTAMEAPVQGFFELMQIPEDSVDRIVSILFDEL